MTHITATGIGSGLDANGILEQIVAAERGPTENRLNLKEAKLQAELSAFGSLKGAISSFQSSLSKLKSPTFFNSSNVSVSNTDVLLASTTSIAQPGTYTVEVTSLAQAQTLASVSYTAIDDVVGSGTLSFSFGTTVYDPGTSFIAGDDTYTSFTQNPDLSSQSVTIDSSNNTLSGIRDAVNAAKIGVNASIVDDGSGFRLLFTAQQGLDNSLQISIDEGGAASANIDTSGLSILAFNSSATNIEQTQAAQDAQLTVNGLSITRESNSIVGAVQGVTLNLLKTDVGNPLQVQVINNNISEAQTNITAFVNSYNELSQIMSGFTEYNAESDKAGILLGDSTTRNIMRQIQRELGGVINNGGLFNGLGSIGITTNRNGSLSLNASTLNSALNDDFDSVAQLFYANGSTANSSISYLNASSKTQDGNYRVLINTLATQAQLNAEAVSGPITIDGTNDSFSLVVDGISTSTLNISQAVYSDMALLAQEMQNRINADSALQTASLGVSVAYASGQFQISSATYGGASSVSVFLQNTVLGLTANATEITASDVSGNIGDAAATGSGQTLTGNGDATGLALQISGVNTGNIGSVIYSTGIAGRLDRLLSQFLDSKGQLDNKTSTLESQISNIAQQRIDLTERVNELEARYRKQFTALDVLISQMNTTSSFLQQQLESLPGVVFNKK